MWNADHSRPQPPRPWPLFTNGAVALLVGALSYFQDETGLLILFMLGLFYVIAPVFILLTIFVTLRAGPWTFTVGAALSWAVVASWAIVEILHIISFRTIAMIAGTTSVVCGVLLIAVAMVPSSSLRERRTQRTSTPPP